MDIRLSLDEIKSEKLDFIKSLKVFCYSIVMVPVAVLTHFFSMIINTFAIPNKVVDIITMSEKTKQIIRKRIQNGNTN